jgi:hypothetical protein
MRDGESRAEWWTWRVPTPVSCGWEPLDPGVERRRTRVSGPWSGGGWRRDRARSVRLARLYVGSVS